MPQKAKFSKEEVINEALSLVEEQGFAALTARALGQRLGSSARPIFTVFSSMEEVANQVVIKAKSIYKSLINKGLEQELAFKGVGQSYIEFATKHPKLFQLLFMKEQSSVPNLHSILGIIEESYEKILSSITNNYGLDQSVAEKLYLHLWIYSHGIAVLIATKVCVFSASEISDMLTQVFVSLLKKIKSEGSL